MKMIALILVFACTTCAFIGWRVIAVKSQSVDHIGIVYDSSDSYTGGCLPVVGSAEQGFSQSNLSPASTLTLLALGDGSTANEPRLLGTYFIPRTRQIIEGLHANSRRRQKMLKDIWEKCNSVPKVSASPIFLAVKQSAALLRAKGCKESSHCQLLVNSDLEENVEPAVKERLNARKSKNNLPAPIDNRGIMVIFCGFAATAGLRAEASGRQIRLTAPRDPNREDRIQQTWRSIFADPESVNFAPYCANPSDPTSFASVHESTGGEQ